MIWATDSSSGHWPSALAATLVAAAAYATWAMVSWALNSRRPKDFPPGPKTRLWLGNMLEMPATQQYLKYTQLGNEYGELVGLKLGMQNVVVLNSARVVNELLDKRHAIYSGRFYDGILTHILANGPHPHITFAEGDYLRRWRAAARLLLRPSALREVLPQNAAGAAICVRRVIAGTSSSSDGNNSRDHSEPVFRALQLWATMSPLHAVCGTSSAENDPAWTKWYMDFAEANHDIMEPSSHPPLAMFPSLSRVPEILAPWKRTARRVSEDREHLYRITLRNAKAGFARYREAQANGQGDLPFETLMARIVREQEEGRARPADDEKTKNNDFTDDELAKLGGGLFEASTHTTLYSFRGWLKILCAHPHVVAKIQEELDAVCGTEVPPTENHIRSLPYLEASLQEAWRYRVPTPVSLPHRLTQDDVFEGYRLPKNTMVVQNSYGILHDAEFFDSPDDYMPERYLGNPTGLRASAAGDPRAAAYSRGTAFVFGAGRRACPGDSFSWQSMMMLMAKLLWTCDLRADDASGGGAAGVDISPEGFFGETVLDPLPWKFTLVPRSDARRRAAELDCENLAPILN